MRRDRCIIVAALLLLAGVAGAVWWWQRPGRVTPPVPSDVHDAEVREALDAARQRIVEQPDSAAAWGQYAKVLLAHLLDRDARFCFEQAARLDPTDPRWIYGQAVIALKREPGRAVALLEAARAVADTRPEYQMLLTLELGQAHLAAERADLDVAENYYRDAWAREPGNPRAALGLGQIDAERGNVESAREYLEAARRSPHAHKTATAQLAALARSQGDKPAAQRFEKEAAALADDPPWPDPLLDEIVELQVGQRRFDRRVAALEKQHRYAEAAQAYLEALARQPTAQAYIGAGINLSRLRRDEEALPLMRKAIELDPDSAHAHFSLALVLFTRAERVWQTAPRTPEPTARFREAAVEAKRAAELRPDHARAYLLWGVALKYLGEPKAAVAPLTKGVACQPGDVELQLALGEVLLEVGRNEEAKQHLENAARLAPADSRPAKAMERLQQAKR